MPAITATQTWSEQNSIRVEIFNVFLNYRDKYDDDVLVYDVSNKPTDHWQIWIFRWHTDNHDLSLV